MGAQIGRTGSFSVQQEITKRFFLVGQGHRVVGKEGCRMGKKRTGTKRSGPVSWVGKNVLLGGLIGAGLCALAAALVMGGVIPQEGLMTAGRCAALLGRTPASLDALQLGMPIFDDNRDARAWYFLPIQEAAVTHTAAQSGAWEQWDALG